MGTSVSTTRTHQRIQQQRELRKQSKYSRRAPNTQPLFTLNSIETTRNNDINTKNSLQLKPNTSQVQSQQYFAINLRSRHQLTNPQDQRETENLNDRLKKIMDQKKLPPKNNHTQEDKILTIIKNQPEKQINSQSSLQQIKFSTKKIHASIQNQTKPNDDFIKTEVKQTPIKENPKKPEVYLDTPISREQKSSIAKFKPVPLNAQFTQFADKQLSEREMKRKEQVIKYIKESQFLADNKTLNNNRYVIGNNLPKKVDELLPGRNLAVDLSPKGIESKQTSTGQTIKLKTQEQSLDLKKVDHSMTLYNKKKNVSSMNTVNKRF